MKFKCQICGKVIQNGGPPVMLVECEDCRPLVRGGQGRSAEDISFSSAVVGWAVLALIGLFVIACLVQAFGGAQ